MKLQTGQVDRVNVTSEPPVPEVGARSHTQHGTSRDIAGSQNVAASVGLASEGVLEVCCSERRRRTAVVKIRHGRHGTHPVSGVTSKIYVPSPCRSPRIASGLVVDRTPPSVKLGGKRARFEGSVAGGDCAGPHVDGNGLDGNNVRMLFFFSYVSVPIFFKLVAFFAR